MDNWKMILMVFVGSIVLVGLMAIGLSKISNDGGVATASVEELVEDARWIAMTGETKVTVTEFSDIQCPACKATEPIAIELRKMEGVRFVYRHFPLTTVHKNAWKGARALEAVRILDGNKSWKMMGLMFDKQEEWSDLGNPDEKFGDYAKSLGLNEEKFLEVYRSEETDKLVGVDSSLGSRLKLSGTPTFFVNGEQIGSSYVLNKVKEVLKP